MCTMLLRLAHLVFDTLLLTLFPHLLCPLQTSQSVFIYVRMYSQFNK